MTQARPDVVPLLIPGRRQLVYGTGTGDEHLLRAPCFLLLFWVRSCRAAGCAVDAEGGEPMRLTKGQATVQVGEWAK